MPFFTLFADRLLAAILKGAEAMPAKPKQNFIKELRFIKIVLFRYRDANYKATPHFLYGK